MPIPASGPISMSMFNTELGRASNTANSSLAGGTTPAVGSQFWLGGQSGSLNQTAPHAMSEWYNYRVSTSTTTTTTTVATFSVSVYGATGTTPLVAADYYYRINSGIWVYLNSDGSQNCTFIGTISGIPSGATLSIGVQDAGNNIRFGATDNSQSCGGSIIYCGLSTPFSTTVTAGKSVALIIQTDKIGQYIDC